jgi:predicted flap endonuclease-1-like 5' DNA nuclease
VNFWGVLALLFAGAFFALLLVTIFYWRSVRPSLLAMPAPAPAASSPAAEGLQDSVQSLNESLVKHSALLARLPSSVTVRAGEDSAPGAADPDLLVALDTAGQEQLAVLQRLESTLNALAVESATTDSQQDQAMQIAALRDQLDRVQQGTTHLQTALKRQQHTLGTLYELQAAPVVAESGPPDDLPALVTSLQDGHVQLQAMLVDQAEALGNLTAAQESNTAQISALLRRFERFSQRRQAVNELRDIRGIGPVYAERLQDAGVHSLAQLIALSPDRIREIVRSPGGLRANVESWIAQARKALAESGEEGPSA